MNTLYFDTFAGISGDMTVGALLALGLPLETLRTELAKLPVAGYAIGAERRFVNGIGAVKFDVAIDEVEADAPRASEHQHDRVHGRERQHDHDHGHEAHDHGSAGHHQHSETRASESHAHGHRAYRDIRTMIEESRLAAGVKRVALAVFAKLAVAEGRVHGVDPDEVRFHEVGAIDSIVDIVGAAIGFQHFQVERFVVGAIPLGSGVIRSQHGPIPVPAPATAELLAGFVTRLNDGSGELVTPTGAAILATLAEQQVEGEGLRIDAIGYGAGTRVLPDRPNLLRLVLGQATDANHSEDVVLIETNVDDASPELFEYVMERLFAAGARDVFLAPILMKKSRPATQLSVLCAPADRERLAAIVLAETTALGVRYATLRRTVLPREVRSVQTEYGEVRVKIARGPGDACNVAPEYEDCRRIAGERNVPLKRVFQAATAAARLL